MIPLAATFTYKAEILEKLPALKEHRQWLIDNRPELLESVAKLTMEKDGHCALSLFTEPMLKSVLSAVLNENCFLSQYGVRSLSKEHERAPFIAQIDNQTLTVKYLPGEGDRSQYKGGNSNWRGPVWMPANYLILRALVEYQKFYGDDFKVPLTAADGTAREITLKEAINEIADRLVGIFRETDGARPAFGPSELFRDESWKNDLLFHEYFHAESGMGLGANHQTGWTALIARIIQEFPIFGVNDDKTKRFDRDNNFYYYPGQRLTLTVDPNWRQRMPNLDWSQRYDSEDGTTPDRVLRLTGNLDVFSGQDPARPDSELWYEGVKLNYGMDLVEGSGNHYDPVPRT